MSRVRVKVCGITRLEDAEAAVRAGVDAVGFVFWPSSPRAIGVAEAAAIAARLPPFVARVGVFVNASPADVAACVREAGLSAAQLHGDERLEEYGAVPVPLIRAVALEHEADVTRALALPPGVTVLVDAVDPDRRGGTGRQASWDLAAVVASRRPVILAGGLTPECVAEAVARVRPWAVDVSSGVESAPGVKNSARMGAFVAAVAAGQAG